MPASSEVQVALAQRVLAHERPVGATATERAEAAGRVYGALCRSLAPVVGGAGVDAVSARSWTLTRAAFPSLRDASPALVPPATSTTIAEHLVGSLALLEPKAAAEIAEAFLARVLGILANLIGDRLVLQLVKKAFPLVAWPEETS